ncbi:hypothetical protein GRI35_02750 [Altererythrobacter aestiaquae]|uniref:Esterase n=2 Tax=Pontixanthobacter aestiaquae TaxID=1509367 RepID=A0A844Z466_9SPHN|nr:hypothetical protein [Pontixanthobacter aestiaquae]
MPAHANPQLAYIEGARANMEVLRTERIRSEQFNYDHAVTIALPASYTVQPERTYPVLWVLDDPLMTRMAISTVDLLVGGNMMPEVIVIGVGSPSEEGLAGVGKRIVEFSPPGDGFAPSGLAAEEMAKVAPFPPYPHRADDFLAFLIDDLRPRLADRYRFSGEHILHGHSLGGMLGGYALFTRPDAFNKMILGSPAMANVDDAVFKAEEAFARGDSTTLPVSIYVGAGGAEGNEWFLSASNILSGTARFVDRLQLRGYDGLEIQSEFYTGEDHYSVAPRVLLDGLRHLYRKEAAEIGSSWPQRPE